MSRLLLATVGGLAVALAMAAGAIAAEPDGVGLFDPATGSWTVRLADGTTRTFLYGNPGDQPLMGDWDCDGEDGPGVYRNENGSMRAFLRNARNSGVADVVFRLGNPGDVAVAGDFNGDGCDSLSVFRPSQNRFYISEKLPPGGAIVADYDFVFEGAGGSPVTPFAGDFDGDGTDGVGLHVTGSCCRNVLLRESLSTGPAERVLTYGNPGDRAVAGDWDGNPDQTIGVYRPAGAPLPAAATFYLRNANSTGIGDTVFPLGTGTELPVAVGVAKAAPVTAAADAYATFGNTELVAGGAAASGPAADGGPGVLANDTGPAPLVASLVSGPANGTLDLQADGSFSYVPDLGFRGPTDSFTYRVTAGDGTAAEAVVTIDVSQMIWYVDNTSSGAGTSADPFGTLAEAEAASTFEDVIFVFAGDGTDTGYDSGIDLAFGQRLFGEGAGLEVQGVQLVAPGARPQLSASDGDDAVRLSSNVVVSGLDVSVTGSGAGLSGDTSIFGGVDVVDVDVSAASDGFRLESIAAAGSFSFVDVHISSSGGRALSVTGGAATITFDPTSSVEATGGTGLWFVSADGTYDFQGPVTLAGGNAGIDILTTSDGTFTFDSLTLTSPTGTGIEIVGGTADVTIGSGSVLTQANDAPLMVVAGDHTGTVAVDAGANVAASNGSGLVFDFAGGTYRFDGPVDLAGGDAGIDLFGDSDGTFTFADLDITDPAPNAAIDINGSNAADLSIESGTISQGNDSLLMAVANGHFGTVTLGPGVSLAATNGSGFRFFDADGTYSFAGPVVLDGGDAGLDIFQASSGTFTFDSLTLTSPTGTGIQIRGSAADLTVGAGSVLTQANDAALLEVSDGHTGTVVFEAGSTASASGGRGLRFVPGDGTYVFDGAVDLAGGDAGIDIFGGNGSITFADLDITDPALSPAINISGGATALTIESGLISQGNNVLLMSARSGHTGTVTLGPGASLAATNGAGIEFFDADGTYTFQGLVDLDGGDAGIDIFNVSDGTFTFESLMVTSPTGRAISVVGGSADLTMGSGSVLTQANDSELLVVSLDHTGTLVLEAGATATATNGSGLRFSDADGTYTFDGAVDLVGGNAGVHVTGGSDGTITFAALDIADPAFNAPILISGGTADVSVESGAIGQSNDQFLVDIGSGHTGTFTLGPAASLTATNGRGIFLRDADGTYTFDGPVVLNGGDAGIDILDFSSGTFTFVDATITDPTGAAFVVGNLEAGAVVDFTGGMSSNGGQELVNVFAASAGSTIEFHQLGGSTLAATNVVNPIGVNNTDGDVTFDIPTTIDNAGFSAISIGAGSGNVTFRDTVITNQQTGDAGVDIVSHLGTVTFTNLDISTDSSGTGWGVVGFLARPGNVVNIFGSDNDITSVGGPAVALLGSASFDITLDDVSATDVTQVGPAGQSGFSASNAGTGTLTVTGTTTIDTTGFAGISVSSTSGTLSFADVDIRNTAGDGILTGTVQDTPATVQVLGGTIDNIGGDGLRAGSVASVAALDISNTIFTNIGGVIAHVTNSILSGSGNVAVPFSCIDGSLNTGSILFNAGADSCP